MTTVPGEPDWLGSQATAMPLVLAARAARSLLQGSWKFWAGIWYAGEAG